MSLPSVRPSHRHLLPKTLQTHPTKKTVKKAPASNKCQAVIGGAAVSSTLIGTIGLIASTILFVAAPLLIPVIAFKAALIAAGALLLLGTIMTLALVIMLKKRPPEKHTKAPKPPIQQPLVQNPLIAQNQDLANQLKTALAQKQGAENGMQTLQSKFQELEKRQSEIQKPLNAQIAQNQDLTNQLKTALTQKQEVEHQMQLLQEKFQAKSQEVEEGQNQIEQLELEKSTIQKRLERLKNRVRGAEQIETKQLSTEVKSQIQKLQQTIQDMEQVEEQSQIVLSTLERELDQLRFEKEQLEEKLLQTTKIPLTEIEILNQYLKNRVNEQEVIINRYNETYGPFIDACVTTPLKPQVKSTNNSNRGLPPRPNILTMDLSTEETTQKK